MSNFEQLSSSVPSSPKELPIRSSNVDSGVDNGRFIPDKELTYPRPDRKVFRDDGRIGIPMEGNEKYYDDLEKYRADQVGKEPLSFGADDGTERLGWLRNAQIHNVVVAKIDEQILALSETGNPGEIARRNHLRDVNFFLIGLREKKEKDLSAFGDAKEQLEQLKQLQGQREAVAPIDRMFLDERIKIAEAAISLWSEESLNPGKKTYSERVSEHNERVRKNQARVDALRKSAGLD